MKKIISSIAALLLLITLQAQEFSEFTTEDFDKDKNYGFFNYVQVTGVKGQHMAAEDLKQYFNDGFYGIGIRVGTQSTGRKEWQRLHNYPQYGFGVSYFDLGNTNVDSILGKPASFYFFYGAPIARLGKRGRLNIDTEIGLSHDFNAYDSEINDLQTVIGSSVNLHANFTLAFYYELSERIDLSLGASFMHFSNGRTFTPNRGINLFGLNLSSSYNFNPIKNYTKHIDPDYQPPIRPELVVAENSPFKGHHEFVFMGSAGTVLAGPGEWKDEHGEIDTTGAVGPRYLTNSFSAEYAYQFARKFKVVGGVDMFYDGSTEVNYEDILPQNTTFADKSFYGYHVGVHYLIERVSFIVNYGRYIYKPFDQLGNYWLRAGGRMGITKNLDIHVALKTRNGGIADWIEWGIAYKIISK
jgi:hypothetical protein